MQGVTDELNEIRWNKVRKWYEINAVILQMNNDVMKNDKIANSNLPLKKQAPPGSQSKKHFRMNFKIHCTNCAF